MWLSTNQSSPDEGGGRLQGVEEGGGLPTQPPHRRHQAEAEHGGQQQPALRPGHIQIVMVWTLNPDYNSPEQPLHVCTLWALCPRHMLAPSTDLGTTW